MFIINRLLKQTYIDLYSFFMAKQLILALSQIPDNILYTKLEKILYKINSRYIALDLELLFSKNFNKTKFSYINIEILNTFYV